MFQTVQFPAGIAHLDTGLSDVDWNDFSHFGLILLSENQVSSDNNQISSKSPVRVMGKSEKNERLAIQNFHHELGTMKLLFKTYSFNGKTSA